MYTHWCLSRQHSLFKSTAASGFGLVLITSVEGASHRASTCFLVSVGDLECRRIRSLSYACWDQVVAGALVLQELHAAIEGHHGLCV
jgi:hypothetical protein